MSDADSDSMDIIESYDKLPAGSSFRRHISELQTGLDWCYNAEQRPASRNSLSGWDDENNVQIK